MREEILAMSKNFQIANVADTEHTIMQEELIRVVDKVFAITIYQLMSKKNMNINIGGLYVFP